MSAPNTPSSFQERCGLCGFTVIGNAQYIQERMADHRCRPHQTRHWPEAVFGIGVVAVVVAGITLMLIFGGK